MPILKEQLKHSTAPFSPDFSPENKDAWERAVKSAVEMEKNSSALWTDDQRAEYRKNVYKNILIGLESKSLVTL